jgi:hypothetical protein
MKDAFSRQSLATALLQTAAIRMRCRETVPVLVEIIRDSKAEKERRDALQTLESLRDPSPIPALVDILNNAPDPKERTAEALDKFQTIDALIHALRALASDFDSARSLTNEFFKTFQTASEQLKIRYIQVLAGVQSSAGEDMLLTFASDRIPRIRYSAITAIGESGTIRSAHQLLQFTKDPDRIIKITAIIAMGKLRFTQGLSEFLVFLGDKDKDISAAAHSALRQTTGCGFGRDPEMWRMWLEREKQAAESDFSFQLLQINRTDGLAKAALMQQVGGMIFMRHKFVETFCPMIDNSNTQVRACACNILAQSFDPKATPYLLSKLNDTAPEVSFAAWRGLRYITGQDLPRDPSTWQHYLEARR